jgi:hypothetical protein
MKTAGSGCKPSGGRVFGPPLLIALISCSGLAAAFALGEAGRVLCWCGVGAPIVVIAWCALRR